MKHSINFSLMTSGIASGTSPIRMRVTYNGMRVDVRTGLSCQKSEWKDGRCISKQRTKWRESASTINGRLATLAAAVDTLFTQCDLVPRFPSSVEVRDACATVISGWTGEKRKKSQPVMADSTVLAAVDAFMATCSELSSWTDGTIKKWNTIRRHLAAFNDSLTMEDVQAGAFDDFLIYLRAQGMRNTTLAKYAKMLRWFLRWAVRHGRIDSSILTDFAPNIKGTDPALRDIVYLELDELLYLESLPIPESMPGVAACRDVFVFCCFTGLRYSDAQRIRRTDVAGDEIRLVSLKDTDPLTIQLNSHSRRILEKYAGVRLPGGAALPTISNQKANEHLKELGALAGLCRRVRFVWYVGAARHEERPQLREVLTTHCARRTFVVTSLRLGISTDVIRSWTGHSSESAMKPYYHIVSEAQRSSMVLFDEIQKQPEK